MSEGNGYASKDAFFGGFKRRWKEIDSPLLGGKVVIGNVSEREHQAFERKLKKLERAKTSDSIRLWYMGLGLWKPERDAAGRLDPKEKMFSDEDIQRMIDSDLDYAITRQLTDEIIKHMGVSPEDLVELEELAKLVSDQSALDGFRLAEIAGAVDDQAVLDTISHFQFRRWQAYFRVRTAEAWEIAGHIAASAWNAAILASQGSPEWKQKMLAEWDDPIFIPPGKLLKREEPKEDPKQGAQRLAEALNAGYGPDAR